MASHHPEGIKLGLSLLTLAARPCPPVRFPLQARQLVERPANTAKAME